MNRRIAFTLVPLAYLTLSCGQPVTFSSWAESEQPTVEVVRQAPPSREVAIGDTAKGQGKDQAKDQAKDQSKDQSKEKSKGDSKQSAQKGSQKAAWPADGIGFGRREPLPKKAGAIRLAAYNLENLFDGKDDPSISGDIDDKTMTTKPERLRNLAAVIKRLDADVLAVEEIESKDALTAFRDEYLKGLGYEYIASVDAGDRRGIEQSVLSRIPIAKVENWPEQRIDDQEPKRTGEGFATAKGKLPERWARSPLVVTLKTKDGYELELFVVHHKSGADFDVQRELEALEVIEIAKARIAANPAVNLAVLGDFNATPNKKSIKLYREAGFANAYDKRFDTKAPSEMYTTHATHRAIDFIWMSPGLAADTLDKSFFVLGSPIPEKLPPMDASDEVKEKSLPKGYASDHMPIAIDLLPRDAK